MGIWKLILHVQVFVLFHELYKCETISFLVWLGLGQQVHSIVLYDDKAILRLLSGLDWSNISLRFLVISWKNAIKQISSSKELLYPLLKTVFSYTLMPPHTLHPSSSELCYSSFPLIYINLCHTIKASFLWHTLNPFPLTYVKTPFLYHTLSLFSSNIL